MPALFDRKSGNCLILAMLMAFGLGTSCSDENLVNDIQGKEQLSFGVSISDKWNTGGTRSAEDEETVSSTKIENSDLWLITTVEDNPDTTLFARPEGETRGKPYTPTDNDGNNDARLKDFGVYAYTYTGEWSSATDKKLYIGGDKVTPSGSVWSTESPRFWPGATYKMKFFAYAPYSTGLYTENEGTITINDFSVNTDVNKQQDLLATIPMADAEGNHNQTLALTFRHILTAIDVKASDPLKRTITSISFSGIATKGKFTLNGETPSWIPLESNVTEISCNVTKEDGVLDANEKYVISDENGTTFLMIPQKLDGATIHVTFDNGDKLSASLSGKEWLIGKRVTYVISDSGIEGVIETSDNGIVEFEYYGGPEEFSIDSYIINGSTKIPAEWTATFVEDDGNEGYKEIPRPYWITSFPESEKGSITLKEYTGQARQQILDNSSNDWLRHDAEKKGTPEEPYDLSTNGGSTGISTANCYIVNGPGTYSFPVVYGNALVDGVNNEAAYERTYYNSNVLANFVRHDGQGISDPWIAGNGFTLNSAKLIWQDVQDLVTNIELKVINSEHYISFDVNQKTIQQGNAIIAVFQGSTVLWSWHIWVTDYPLREIDDDDYTDINLPQQLMKDRTVKTADGRRTYTFMGPPLGWCYGGTYPEREAKVRIKQKITGEEKVITIIQKAFTIGNNAPYYQWGRKDPMIPYNGTDTKYYYKTNGECSNTIETANNWDSGITNIINGIQNPGKYCAQAAMDNKYFNLWDINSNTGYSNYLTEATSKTVYDPSPVGYKVPSNDASSGFTLNGENLKDGAFTLSKCNSPYTAIEDYSTNNGWVFYCNRMLIAQNDL